MSSEHSRRPSYMTIAVAIYIAVGVGALVLAPFTGGRSLIVFPYMALAIVIHALIYALTSKFDSSH